MRKPKNNAMLRGFSIHSTRFINLGYSLGQQKMKITGTVIDNTNEPIILELLFLKMERKMV